MIIAVYRDRKTDELHFVAVRNTTVVPKAQSGKWEFVGNAEIPMSIPVEGGV